jgi:alpha-D-xyloside xylohydrolase
MAIMRALALNYQDDQRAREAKDEYLFGPDFLVAPVIDENVSRVVYLPAGEWVNYWTGKVMQGGMVTIAAAPLGVVPLYVRPGAIIPKIPEDVMTLVPTKESGNTSVKSMDDRRVYELMPGADSGTLAITDFEGRKVARSGDSLTVIWEVGTQNLRRGVALRQHGLKLVYSGSPINTGRMCRA